MQLAEGSGNGGLMVTMYTHKLDDPDTAAAARHARFVGGDDHRHLFVDRTRMADTALVWSAPTLMWRRFASLIVGSPFAPGGLSFYAHFAGVARVLEDTHVPHEVLMLGHPDVFDDTASVTRFAQYKRLVLAVSKHNGHAARCMLQRCV